MPEESKKNQDKKKNEPKEQRKPRNSRNHGGKAERTSEKVGESKSAPKAPQKPPVYEDPGEEFYKNLKRETEDILKITEAENSKYRKKEIQSNWSKYEMPIESYEEIDDHDVGADYEKLIQAPLSIGGHFQFKHEKCWDINTGPSLYDKYFEINMDNLSLAVSTIPFYERNGIEQSLFSETDMLTMNNRAIKYKQKYFNDKSYATAETEAQDKILNSLKESLSKKVSDSENIETVSTDQETISDSNEENRSAKKDDINLDFKSITTNTDNVPSTLHSVVEVEEINKTSLERTDSRISADNVLKLEKLPESKPVRQVKMENMNPPKEIIDTKINVAITNSETLNKNNELPTNAIASNSTEIILDVKSKDKPVDAKKNPVIESPEDLEKWLDDFLEG